MTGNDSSHHAQFHTTRWSIVLEAKDSDARNLSWQESLSTLCEAYWFPLYAYLRRKGYSAEDSQDLVQAFFGTLIEKDFLKVVAPEKGRFRWFLMDAISKFAASWNSAKSAQKRGGGKNFVSIDAESVESRYQIEPADQQTPESLFERQWALSVIQQAMDKLQDQYYADGKQRLFDGLKKYLIPDSQTSSYAETAEGLDLTETAIKVAIHRLRQKFTKSIHEVVLETLDDPAELDEEVNSLLESLS